MAEIVNLNRARKAKARAKNARQADANRITHGTPKAIRKLSEARKDKAEQRLLGHKLESENDQN